jgi:enamine deaminase RidA (YjgF/YER057c/UK114 family)
MGGRIDAVLTDKGIELPRPSTPLANYVPWSKVGNLVFVAGQVTLWEGERRFVGKVGKEFTLEQGQQAARLVGQNVLAQLREACGGDLDKVRKVVRLNGFVNCVPEFTDQPAVMNAASELMIEVFGEAGRHTRTAVGAASLPFGVAVEIDGIFEVEG